MSRNKPRKLVPVSKLAEFADDPDAFRKTRSRVRDPKAAAAGTQAHRERVKPRQTGQRLVTATIIGVVVVAALLMIFH